MTTQTDLTLVERLEKALASLKSSRTIRADDPNANVLLSCGDLGALLSIARAHLEAGEQAGELRERLRLQVSPQGLRDENENLMEQAADALTAMQAEIQELKTEDERRLEQIDLLFSALEERIASLRRAEGMEVEQARIHAQNEVNGLRRLFDRAAQEQSDG